MQKQLDLSLSVTRPYLYVGPSASKQLDKFTLKIENVGNIPARFILRDQEIWIDRKVIKRLGPINPVQNVLFSGKGVASLRVQVLKEVIEDLRTRKRCLEMAMCIIYETTNSSDTRRWLGTAHYIFDPAKGTFDIREQGDREVSESLQQCKVGPPLGCDRRPPRKKP